jgi:hypothetical protein
MTCYAHVRPPTHLPCQTRTRSLVDANVTDAPSHSGNCGPSPEAYDLDRHQVPSPISKGPVKVLCWRTNRPPTRLMRFKTLTYILVIRVFADSTTRSLRLTNCQKKQSVERL